MATKTDTSSVVPEVKEEMRRKRFLVATIGLIGVGAITELYATAAIATERIPGNAAELVALGTASLVGGIATSFGSMPQAVETSSAISD